MKQPPSRKESDAALACTFRETARATQGERDGSNHAYLRLRYSKREGSQNKHCIIMSFSFQSKKKKRKKGINKLLHLLVRLLSKYGISRLKCNEKKETVLLLDTIDQKHMHGDVNLYQDS